MANRADFAPELGALKSLRPFVFWAQTTLPTVFDDSLSYYEVLTKLCKMVNTMLENEDTNAENITALAEAYQELEDFTNNYFENLDVTQEINDKLDELVADGTIGGYVVERATTLVNNYLYGEDGESGVNKTIQDLISDADTDIENALSDFAADSSAALTNFNAEKTTLMNDLRDDIDNALDAIPTTVNAWLDDNITQPSSTVIDSSLTLHGAAAEAYATGDAINQARNVALANTDYQSFVTDDIPNQYVTAAYDGTNARIATDSSSSPLRPMKIANVVEGETYLISCVGSIIGPTQFCPAYAFVEKTEDLQGNIVRTIVDIYPRSWTEQDQYEIIRNRYITIPDISGYTINELILMSNTDIAVDATCTRLNVKTDSTLTSATLPAQGKATGDALDTKIPWPVTGGSKDVGTAGKRLASNGDGTTRWDEDENYGEEIADLQSDVADLKSTLYTEISNGSKTQGGNYATNAINIGDTLKAGKTYKLSLRFDGPFSSFLTYLNYLYMATGNSSSSRVENIIELFRAIEQPLSVYTWHTVEYTPIADVSWICPQYTSNYTPSDSYSISYKIVEKESRIDKLEQQIGDDDFYNFTPINTWEENAVPSAITQKLNTMANDVLCVFQGDSLTGLIEYSGAQDEPEHCPPGMQYKSWTYWLWENMARVKPLCDRLDSQRNGADFFSKTGAWEQVGGTKFDNDNYTWDMSQERSVACMTYQSASSNADVAFTFDADTYDKCSIVFSLKPDGADCEIAIAEGNGKMLVSLDRSNWFEANGFSHSQRSNPDGLTFSQVQSAGLAIQQRHRRLWMKKVSGVTGNITVTYKRASSSASGSYMYCWGTERWSGNTVFVDNIGRGGRYTKFLSYNISDIFDRNPDFAVYEMPIANETDDGLSNIYGYYQQYFLSSGNNSYKTRSENYTKVPLIVFLPHGRGLFFNYDNAAIFDAAHQVVGDPPAYVIYMTIWDWLKDQLANYGNVSVINLYCRMLNEATGIGQPIRDVFGSNGEYAFTQDTTHLNARGARMYCKYLLPLFQR